MKEARVRVEAALKEARLRWLDAEPGAESELGDWDAADPSAKLARVFADLVGGFVERGVAVSDVFDDDSVYEMFEKNLLAALAS